MPENQYQQNSYYGQGQYPQDPYASGQLPQQYQDPYAGQYQQYQQNAQYPQYSQDLGYGQADQYGQYQADPYAGQYQQYPQEQQYQQYSQEQQYQQYGQGQQQYQQQYEQQYGQQYAQSAPQQQYQQNPYDVQANFQNQYGEYQQPQAQAVAKVKPNKGLLIASKVLTITGSVILALSIIMCLALVVPRLFGIMPYTVLTGSMEPDMPVGSLVYVKDTSARDLNVGDVVTFAKSSTDAGATVVTHRVAANNKAKEELTTKGDANESEDPQPVPYGNVLGKVVMTIPAVGSFVAILDTFEGKAAMVAIVVGALIICLVGDQIRRAAKRAARKANERSA